MTQTEMDCRLAIHNALCEFILDNCDGDTDEMPFDVEAHQTATHLWSQLNDWRVANGLRRLS